jgi:hypothetical protein
MPHRKTLTQLGWFKVAFFVPFAVGAIVAAIIICNDPYFLEPTCLTSGCLNEAFNRLKIPITIAALIFPAVALVASHHRSAQTAAQIERTDKQIAATESKNAFENCIKHRELFLKMLSELERKLDISCHRQTQLYNLIFINNNYVEFSAYADLDDFRAIFLDFDQLLSYSDQIRNTICYMREVLYSSIFVDINQTINGQRNCDSDETIIKVYERLIDGLADFCLSPEDRLEIFDNDIIVIKDARMSLDIV